MSFVILNEVLALCELLRCFSQLRYHTSELTN